MELTMALGSLHVVASTGGAAEWIQNGTAVAWGESLFVDVGPAVTRTTLAALLGLFLGLEREWSGKSAGVRTFAFVALLGAVLTLVDRPGVVAVGGMLVLAMGGALAVRGLLANGGEEGLFLTTWTSLFVAYGLGVLVATGRLVAGVTVAMLSALLLVLKRELHEFAWGLTKAEMRSAAEFAIVAFVVYPLLPDETIGPWDAVHPPTVWLLVVAVSAIGFANYVLVRKYEGRGVAVTGFFGGLINSTAVVAEMAGRARTHPAMEDLAVGAILLANAAMAVRNAVIVALFVPGVALVVGVPLASMALVGVLVALLLCDWGVSVDTDLTSPFSTANALTFGALFLVVLVVAAGAQATVGAGGFLLTMFLAGLVSSGTAVTSAVTLVSTGGITTDAAVWGVIAGTAASILVKVAFAATIDRSLVRPVLGYSLALIAVGEEGTDRARELTDAPVGALTTFDEE